MQSHRIPQAVSDILYNWTFYLFLGHCAHNSAAKGYICSMSKHFIQQTAWCWLCCCCWRCRRWWWCYVHKATCTLRLKIKQKDECLKACSIMLMSVRHILQHRGNVSLQCFIAAVHTKKCFILVLSQLCERLYEWMTVSAYRRAVVTLTVADWELSVWLQRKHYIGLLYIVSTHCCRCHCDGETKH